MFTKINKTFLFSIIIFLLLFAPFTFAQISEPTNKPIADILADLVDWLLSLVGIIAVAMIIIGGVLYLTAGGSERQLEMAKKTLIYTVIGLLICGISYVIVKTVAEILTK